MCVLGVVVLFDEFGVIVGVVFVCIVVGWR